MKIHYAVEILILDCQALINIKNGQQNKNNKLIHKKSESTGFGYKQKSKRNNLEEFINVDNNKVKPNINKNNPFIANTNYNSKSHSRKETKLKSNINNNINKNNKSAKILTNVKKEIYFFFSPQIS